ncbi:T9SS type A sorting domain-containing protein [Flavobacterium jejuense]|uniref:Aminopeptidase N n=1 Tax=Flavobacterium jejuense TaxID=1544455 RepID=A0ABX0IV99_9FLAO|nr:M1 family aminopeptidase [Flavobacterium jejuense]NHN27106.1 T9SS type A sorting domain-containing protein [Flavobacterium jejuense]
MKKYLLPLLILLSIASYSQIESEEFNRMVEAEMKSASSLQNIQVNPNTQNYDVTYQELRFEVDPAVYNISGQVTTTFTALSDMNMVTFDLTNQLTVSSVTMNSNSLSFIQNANNELVITLPTTISTGNNGTVVITYSGAPASGEAAFTTSTHNGTPIIYTLSEPFGARDWWPCKQDLSDKIESIDVYITAPIAYVSVSNGLEQSAIDNGNGTKTTHFHHGYAIPAYLVAIAVTNYQVFTQTAGTIPNDFPIVNYIYPENFSSAQTQLAQTLPIMNVYETLFEPYPFHNEKYGHAQFGWGGGMEHTTVSFMNSFGRNLIAHELAHQWFGDKVTCGSWKDIWLNEGFAEYLSGLVVENLDGASSFVSWKNGKINNITSQTTGAVYLTDTEALNVNRIFSSRLSYNKGAMVIHMLRWKMGDAAFFQAIKNYLADSNLAYKYAVTDDLKSHLEAVFGSNLDEYFNDWLYGEGYPSYTVTAQNWGNGQAKITISQTQSDASVSYFEMPLEIRLINSTGQTYDVIVNHQFDGQEFIVSVPFPITGVEFDPNSHIISRNNITTLGNENFELAEIVTLYPNPSNKNLHIQLPSTITIEKIECYNALGQLVLTNHAKDFSIETLTNGIHFAKISTSEGVIHKKFIKK